LVLLDFAEPGQGIALDSIEQMRILFALPGLHRHDRGAEVAFISVARELAKSGETVTLIGSGKDDITTPYRFFHAHCLAREHFEAFPSMPMLRNECAYEDLTFAPSLLRNYRPADYDVTLTCSYPFTNWVLRRKTMQGTRPPHVFVTQNGDWPAYANSSEYRFFGCDGLVCTNPDFYERNKTRWHCRLIPNGVDCNRFYPGAAKRQEFDLPADALVVLMVSALVPTKRVSVGIEAVSQIPDAHLVVAGDGLLRQEIDATAARLLPNRFTRLSIAPERMPDLYRSANVFLHLSKEESFGNVFLEALACGLPVVAHDSARARWIVGDEEYLLDTSDTDAVAKHIEFARDAHLEQQHRRVTKAATFSWQKIALMYREYLQEVVDASEISRQ
jgi:glycosyltransferase involved in cell wall biosynthesis